MLVWRNQEKAVSTRRHIYRMLRIKLQRKLQSGGKGVRRWAQVTVINRDSDWDQVRKDVKEAAKGHLGESPADKGRAVAKARAPAEAALPHLTQQPQYGLALLALTPPITGTRSAGTPRSPCTASLASDSEQCNTHY